MVTLDAVQLEDLGFGPHMIPVAPIGVQIAPGSSLREKVLGKAPGKYTISGWTGIDVNDPKMRCPDYQTAKLWRDWGASIGLAAGEGLAIIDNDQGAEFSEFLSDAFISVGVKPLRRYVKAPKHERDAWLFMIRDFIGDPVSLSNRDYLFRNGVKTAKVQLLSKGKQLVVSGIHRDTKGPYVLDRELAFDQIPVLSESRFELVWKRFVLLCQDHGWMLEGVAWPLAPQAPVSHVHTLVPVVQPIDPVELDESIAGARNLLALIPNRDTLPGEPRTETDEWLDEPENYWRIAYLLAAHLGPAAGTPQARDLFLEWALGRAQEQDPDTVWSSVTRNPIRFGSRSLVEFLKERRLLPPAPFPDIDLNDPAFKLPPTQTMAPAWHRLRSEWAYCATDPHGFVNLMDGSWKGWATFSGIHNPDRKALLKELHGKGPQPSVAELYTRQKDRDIVYGLAFHPGASARLPDGVFNRWIRRPAPSPVSRTQVQDWLDHLDFVLGAEAALFIRWCAFVVQYPELKPNWHPLIMTEEGVGKDMMMRPILSAVGKGNHRTADIEDFTKDFNEPLETKLLVISEVNGFQDANNRHLKRALAAPPETITINPKFKVKFDTVNRLAVVMFSNKSEPLKLDEGQRRIYVINRLHVKKKPLQYYVDFDQWLDVNGEAVVAYLFHYTLTQADIDFFRGPAPKNSDTVELEDRSGDPAFKVLEEIIEQARRGVGSVVRDTGSLAGAINSYPGIKGVTPHRVNRWLSDLEKRKQGVGRLRDGRVISDGRRGGRLWHLTGKHPDGRAWTDLKDTELLDMRDGVDVKPRGNGAAPSPAGQAFTVELTAQGDEIV